MKANTDVKAGSIFGVFVFVTTNVASNHNATLQLGALNVNLTSQEAVAG